MIYGLVVSMQIKQNGLWVNPPDKLQWRLNNQWHQASSEVEWVLATDSDFSGDYDGLFRYIGTDKYVIIPHVIKGVNITLYNSMFINTSVMGVESTNKNVTNTTAMFYGSQATSLDLSSFDASNVTTMNNMFRNSKATIGYARTQADADRFNSSSSKPSTLNFVVKN